MFLRRMLTVLVWMLLVSALGALAWACGGGGGEETSLDDFVSSALPVCSEFQDDVSLSDPDPAPYDAAASALAELAVPSDSAERERAEALVAAMAEAAVATREFSNAVDEYVDPGMTWMLNDLGNMYQYEESIFEMSAVSNFPAEIGPNYLEAKDALRQAAAGVSLLDCAPPEQDGDGNGETPTTDGETPAAGETPATDGGGLEALEALAGEWASSSAKVSYDFSSSFDSEADSGSMTLYWRPPDWRMDISDTDGGDVTMIAADNTTYFCSEGICLAIESTESPLVPPFPFLGSFTEAGALSTSIAEAALGVDVDHFQENIAGESASCFSTSGSVAGGAGGVEWCFTDDGILLRFASTSEGEIGAGDFTLEATAVSRDLSDSDFEPPFPVEEFEIPDLEDLEDLIPEQ